MGHESPDLQRGNLANALMAQELKELLEIELVVETGMVRGVAFGVEVVQEPRDWCRTSQSVDSASSFGSFPFFS